MNNKSEPKNPKEHLQQLNILHLSLLGGQVMIATVLYFMIGKDMVTEMTETTTQVGGFNPVLLICIAGFIGAVSASFLVYNKKKSEGAALKTSLMEKLKHHRSSFVLRAALLEGANLIMIIIFFFMEGNIILAVLFVIGIGLFWFIRPTAEQIIQDYQLSGSEQSELRNAAI